MEGGAGQGEDIEETYLDAQHVLLNFDEIVVREVEQERTADGTKLVFQAHPDRWMMGVFYQSAVSG